MSATAGLPVRASNAHATPGRLDSGGVGWLAPWSMTEGAPQTIHTIPVPAGWSVEQAWEAISRGDELPASPEGTWANVLVEADRLVGTAP